MEVFSIILQKLLDVIPHFANVFVDASCHFHKFFRIPIDRLVVLILSGVLALRRCITRYTFTQKDVFKTVLSEKGISRLIEVAVLIMTELVDPQIFFNLVVMSILKLDLIEYLYVLLQMLSQHILQNGLLISLLII